MKMFKYFALFAVLFAATSGAQTPRYFVRNSTDVIVAFTLDDRLSPSGGQTAVNASTIAAAYPGTIYQGGTWDGTNYTPPAGIVLPIDTATDARRVQQAANTTWCKRGRAARRPSA